MPQNSISNCKIEILTSGSVLVKSGSDCQDISSIRIESINAATGFPAISHNLTLYNDLHSKMHIHSVNLSPSKINYLTKVKERSYTMSEVLNDLARINNTLICPQHHLEMVATILAKIRVNGVQESICFFTAQQLRLLSSPPNSRKYSPFLLSNTAVRERTSLHLYNNICTVAIHSACLSQKH